MCKFHVYARHPKTKKLLRVEELWTTGDCGFAKGDSLSYRHPRFGRTFIKRAA